MSIHITRYDAASYTDAHDAVTALGGLDVVESASARPEFELFTATDACGRTLGYAAATAEAGHLHLDPVVLGAGLPRSVGDRVAAALVDAALTHTERPWADVAVAPASAATGALRRLGWRPVKTPHDSPVAVFSGADAAA